MVIHLIQVIQVVIDLHESIEIGKSISLRSTRRLHIFSNQLSVDYVLLLEHFLAPNYDIVHVWSRHTGELSNTPGNNKTHRNILGEVAIPEIRQIFLLPINLDLSHWMCQTAISFVGTKHRVNIGFVPNIIAVGANHPLRNMMKSIKRQRWIFFQKNSFQLKYFIRNLSKFLTSVFICTVVKKGRLIKRLGNIFVTIKTVRNGWMPNTIDIHEGDSQEVIGRVESRTFSNQLMEEICDRFLCCSMLR
mmetsp:Transcript_9004/g.19162  ORF Transcript_9004/g.19162 Transcript_9004/m.19162 type:complete len:247 (-) Transcript_9004:530-1270(-)